LEAADAPAEHAQAVDHRGMRVGAEQRVGKRVAALRILGGPHHPAQSLEVDLMADPHPGWHYREVVECLLRPAQQRVALSIARVLPLDVAGIGTQEPNASTWTEWSMTRSTWTMGSIRPASL